MTRPNHHPSAEVLASYASGLLVSGFGLVVAAHVNTCAQCRAQIGAYEAASGAALAELPREEVAAGALARAMARLDQAPEPASATNISFPDALPLKRKKWIAPGVWVAAVDTPHAPDNRVYVLSVGPGRPTARHAHSGAEFCVVLKGAFRDETGFYGAGDFAMAEGNFDHQPIVEGEEACVCLFATEGRLKPKGLLGRLAFGFADV